MCRPFPAVTGRFHILWQPVSFTASRGFFLCLLFMAAGLLSAQERRLKFNRLSTQQGLPHMNVYQVIQDQLGFMWFATHGGLARFDGYQFKVYNSDPLELETLASDDLSTLLPTSDGKIWVGTWGAGLNVFDPKTEKVHRFPIEVGAPAGPGDRFIHSLYEDSKKRLWIGTFQNGFDYCDLKTGVFRHYGVDPSGKGLRNARIWDFAEDTSGRIWIATSSGLQRFDPETEQFETFLCEPADPTTLSNNLVLCLEITPDGSLWAGTLNGLNRFNAETGTFIRILDQEDPLDPTLANHFRAIWRDPGGVFWLGTNGGGVKRFDPVAGQFESYRNDANDPYSLSGDVIQDICQDRDGNIWFSSMNAGINILDPLSNPFFTYQNHPAHSNSLSRNQVTALMLQDDLLWIGTQGGGLNRLDLQTGNYRHYLHGSGGLTSNSLLSLFGDKRGGVWIGYHNGVLDRLDPVTHSVRSYRLPVRLQLPNSRELNRVHTMLELDDEQFLVGSDAGINRFDAKSGVFRLLRNPHPYSSETEYDPFYKIFKLQDGRILAGSKVGLFFLDQAKEQLERIDLDGSQFQRQFQILSIHQVARDKLWLGLDDGLAQFNPETRKAEIIRDFQGINRQSIIGIEADRQGKLWLLSPSALFQFDQKGGRFRRYDMSDGLVSTSYEPAAFCQSSSGKIFFGGNNGVCSFDPYDLRLNNRVPPIVFTDLRIFQKGEARFGPAPYLKSIELAHQQNDFTIEFAALNYRSPEKNLYQYQLEGFDDGWRPVSDVRLATYTNLDPGNYTFRVRAANNDGIWNEIGSELHLRIIPPFWKQAWFRGLILLSLIALAYYLVRLNRRMRRRLQERVEERTQSLQAANQALEATARSLRETQRQLLSSAHRAGMAEIAVDVLHNVGNVLNSVKVSSNMIETKIEGLRVSLLRRLWALFNEHRGDLPAFLATDRGQASWAAIADVIEYMDNLQRDCVTEISLLNLQIQQINDIVMSQREYAMQDTFQEELNLPHLIEDVLVLHSASIEEFGILIHREIGSVPLLRTTKSKMLHVLNHLVKNACEALEMGRERGERQLTLYLALVEGDVVRLEVRDNGIGIARESLIQIFSQGFTTKPGGAGYGLHYCANALKEMGGVIGVKSPGPGKGATFVVEIPVVSGRSLKTGHHNKKFVKEQG